MADPSAQVSLGQEEEELVRRGRAPTRILPGDQDGPLVRPRASSRDAAGVWRDMRERERLIEQERILVRGIVSERRRKQERERAFEYELEREHFANLSLPVGEGRAAAAVATPLGTLGAGFRPNTTHRGGRGTTHPLMREQRGADPQGPYTMGPESRGIARMCSREMSGLRGRVSAGPSGSVKKPKNGAQGRGRAASTQAANVASAQAPSPGGAPRRSKPRDQACPVEGCLFKSAWIKRHIYEHFPPVFRPLEGEGDPDRLGDIRVTALRYLARTLPGAGGDLNDLLRYVNRRWRGPCGSVTPEWDVEMRALARYMGWPAPTTFRLQPLDSPAGLMHYRPMSFMWNCLTGQQKEAFHRAGAMPANWPQTPQSGRDLARDRPTPPRVRVVHVPPAPAPAPAPAAAGKPSRVDSPAATPREGVPPRLASQWEVNLMDLGPGDPLPEMPATASPSTSAVGADRLAAPLLDLQGLWDPPQAVDSHFHFDRLEANLRAKGLGSKGLACVAHTSRTPEIMVRVVGGVLNYCDPKNFGRILFPQSSRWRVAVGIHPRHARRAADVDYFALRTLLGEPRVVAISEMGLDHSLPKDTWGCQLTMLDHLLQMPLEGKVLVLHLRGRQGDPMGVEVHHLCRERLRGLPTEQRVHLHCCQARLGDIMAWRAIFPNAHFGYSALARHFNREQAEALRAVPLDRLLLESDAPHLPPAGVKINSPAYLGEIAHWVASHRDETVRAVLMAATENAIRLYQM